MKNKKTVPIQVYVIVLMVLIVPMQITSALPPPPDYTVIGYIYLNGVPVTQNGDVIISNSYGQYYVRSITQPGGIYKKSFPRTFATYGETIYFNVRLGYNYYTPVVNPSFTIPDQPPVLTPYQIDLYLSTSTNRAPYQPTNPSPSNGATGVGLNPTLSVTVSDPDGDLLDVYFYNAATNELIGLATYVVSGSTVSIVWPGRAPNTPYSWYAVASDSLLQNTSSTWSFTTMNGGSGNNPPYQPQTPTPVNHALNVPVTGTILGWTGGDPDGDPVTYDVYFGTSNPPTTKVSANQSGTTCNPGALAYSTSYYWKIIAWDNHGYSNVGSVWDFTTISAPNNPPYTPGNITPVDGATGQSINTDLSWTGGDPDVGDTVTYSIYFGVASNPPLYDTITRPATTLQLTYDLPTLLVGTQYFWKIVATDNHGATVTSPIWSFTTVPPGDNEPPSNITGLTVTDAHDGKLNIAWNPATDNVAVSHYQIYRDGVFLLNRTTTSYQDTGLTNEQSYAYRIRAVDTSGNLGPLCAPVSGVPTASNPGSGGGGNGGGGGGSGGGSGGGGSINKPPVADAGGPYTGFVDEQITFNATGSYDNDTTNIITRYDWKFFADDTWHSNIGPKPTYTYTQPGTYLVTVRVTDDENSTATDTALVTILTGNNPPTQPTITGPAYGEKNKQLEYTFVATDADNDALQYHVSWGDGETTTTTFFPSGTEIIQIHQWATAGRFVITATAFDNQTESGSSTYVVLIDAQYVGTYGFLIDTDGDGIYDRFYSNATSSETTPQKLSNGHYILDIDNDGIWDIDYDPQTKTITTYTEQPSEASNALLIFGLLLLVLAVLVGILILVGMKKRTDQQQLQPQTEKQPSNENKPETKKEDKTGKNQKKK
ncbi:MAG: PKD domain-containing protein [Candidatus Thermoplasmatota archaeon]